MTGINDDPAAAARAIYFAERANAAEAKEPPMASKDELVKRLDEALKHLQDHSSGKYLVVVLEARDALKATADALEAAERERDAAYKRGYRDAYNSGIKALADMGVEFSRLAIGVQEQLDLVKESAAELVDTVEGRASSAPSLFDVSVPDDTGELYVLATGQKGGDDEPQRHRYSGDIREVPDDQ